MLQGFCRLSYWGQYTANAMRFKKLTAVFTEQNKSGTICFEMPISNSAKKALRSAERKTSLNRYRKARLKDALRVTEDKQVNTAVSLIDKAAKWGIIHPNKAARLKSRLSKKFGSTTTAEAKKSAPKKPKTAIKKK